MRKLYFLCAALAISSFSWSQKKVLDHSVYDSWKSITSPSITDDGQYMAYSIDPQEGDGKLVIQRLRSKDEILIDRGYKFQFTPDGGYAVCLIKPFYQDTRQARIKKLKEVDLPQDSLAIIDLKKAQLRKFPSVKSYKLGQCLAPYVAFESQDTALIKKKELRKKKSGRPLLIYQLETGKTDTLFSVTNYTFSDQGDKLVTVVSCPDKKQCVNLYQLPSLTPVVLSKEMSFYTLPVFSKTGSKLTFIASEDTLSSGSKRCNLYLYDQGSVKCLVDKNQYPDGIQAGWAITENGAPRFSENAERILVGIAPVLPPKDTTIVDFEVASLDIWHYADPELQPMQLIRKNRDLKKSYLSLIDLNHPSELLPLTDSRWETVQIPDNGNSSHAVILDYGPYKIESNWEGAGQKDIILLDIKNHSRKCIAQRVWSKVNTSPDGKYLLWFSDDQQWYCYNIARDVLVCLTKECGVSFADEDFDRPMFVPAYGIAGWTEGDKEVLIYDRYDIWKFSPDGKASVNLTQGKGRREKYTFRYLDTKQRTCNEKEFINSQGDILLSVFDNETKRNGYATMLVSKANAPLIHVLDEYTFSRLKKAQHADIYIYQKENFNTSPDMYVTYDLWKHEKCLSDINPQMKEYNWGTAELVSWKAFDGTPLKGILYKPEDFDASAKYPMILYFYERKSQTLYNYYAPAPSRSTINIPFYCSRGYLVFVPDIVYTTGVPGESAYNCIVSGVESLCKNSWVDRENIAIQGQSWGGYQVAYLVTRTPIFKAAGAGAPVANMTSAYGGIRWESGECRQFQYEHTQSRIGRSLWEAPELYISNSPLFRADRVETPLLIMHNDKDGAVPWYQGIEFFTALRRLGKKVWMLQYNNEAHNLVERRNKKDLSIRLQQFFDHYLKGAPMPVWMEKGVPATMKGETWGLELRDK